MNVGKPIKPSQEAEKEFDQFSRDVENIELMNQWGKEDSERAREKTAAAKSNKSQKFKHD